MPKTTFRVGNEELCAYLAVPEGEGPWPGVVVLHEGGLGLNGDIKRQADRFAEHGYVGLAPDLYSTGPRIMCIQRAARDMFTRRGKSWTYIEAARAELAARPDATGRVGVAGFCQGGGFAVVAAARFDFAAAAVNYGDIPSNLPEELKGACPIVASYGKKDLYLRGTADKLERSLTELGIPHDVKEYPDAGHGFMTDLNALAPLDIALKITPIRYGVGKHNADDGWKRTFAFFDEHVKSGVAH